MIVHVHVHNSLTPTYVMESDWYFREGEKLFVKNESVKKGYIIKRVTHDLVVEKGVENKHIVRLNVIEKRVFN